MMTGRHDLLPGAVQFRPDDPQDRIDVPEPTHPSVQLAERRRASRRRPVGGDSSSWPRTIRSRSVTGRWRQSSFTTTLSAPAKGTDSSAPTAPKSSAPSTTLRRTPSGLTFTVRDITTVCRTLFSNRCYRTKNTNVTTPTVDDVRERGGHSDNGAERRADEWDEVGEGHPQREHQRVRHTEDGEQGQRRDPSADADEEVPDHVAADRSGVVAGDRADPLAVAYRDRPRDCVGQWCGTVRADFAARKTDRLDPPHYERRINMDSYSGRPIFGEDRM